LTTRRPEPVLVGPTDDIDAEFFRIIEDGLEPYARRPAKQRNTHAF
jgi:hypothetical protein